jgi:hypothetical protein
MSKIVMCMKTDETICLNSKVNGKQPSLEFRIYHPGGWLPLLQLVSSTIFWK